MTELCEVFLIFFILIFLFLALIFFDITHKNWYFLFFYKTYNYWYFGYLLFSFYLCSNTVIWDHGFCLHLHIYIWILDLMFMIYRWIWCVKWVLSILCNFWSAFVYLILFFGNLTLIKGSWVICLFYHNLLASNIFQGPYHLEDF